MEKRSRQRVRDQVAHLAFGAESRMRSSARGYPWWPGTQRSVQGPDTDAQDQLSPDRHFRLATRGRSIQMGQIRTHAPQQGTSYSITWSARTSSVGGTARPSAFAVFRLTSNSNLVACSIGKSAGLVPWRILSTNTAARRNVAKTFTRSRSDRQPVQAPCFRAKECAAFLPAPRSPQHWH